MQSARGEVPGLCRAAAGVALGSCCLPAMRSSTPCTRLMSLEVYLRTAHGKSGQYACVAVITACSVVWVLPIAKDCRLCCYASSVAVVLAQLPPQRLKLGVLQGANTPVGAEAVHAPARQLIVVPAVGHAAAVARENSMGMACIQERGVS